MRFLEQSRPAVFLVAAASAVFVIQALAWPLTEGRAGEFELLYFLDFWNRDPVFPGLMTKTPVPGLFFGFLLERGGAFGTELAVGACFVAAVYFVYRSGAIWSVPIGIAAAGATLLHVSYGGLFHKLDSDGLFAVAFAAWLYYSLKHADEHSVAVYFVHGLFVALLVMIRPANEVLVLFAVYPLLAGRQRLRRRLRYAAAFVAPVALLVGGWLTLNGVRYGEFSFSRFSNAAPLYHIMMSGHSACEKNLAGDNGRRTVRERPKPGPHRRPARPARRTREEDARPAQRCPSRGRGLERHRECLCADDPCGR